MNTICNYRHTYENGETKEWEIEAMIIDMTENTMEVVICGRGSEFDVIVVDYGTGRFLSIPELNEGCQLARLRDFNWNFEKLCDKLNETDAATIAKGLSVIGRNLELHAKAHNHEVR